jgi:mannose/cellobiose epimerase-like protein (N-acyl-D-glucosamine 2-epimerase family)
VDPGHATECAGFLAELAAFLSEPDRQRILDAALNIHLFADEVGYVETGVMTKYVDLDTREVLPDYQAGSEEPTAPWWNVREHCASSLRLYTLCGDERLPETYRKAQNASYLHYPNKRIGGQMIQTIHPYTLKPLDIPPATGNLDPMHDPRARIREIESLDRIIAAGG